MSDELLNQHNEVVGKVIETVNQIKNDGTDIQLISAAMMTATCIYSTYVEAGNQGFLQADGIDKLTDRFRQQLEFIQQRKKLELKAAGHDVDKASPRSGVVGS